MQNESGRREQRKQGNRRKLIEATIQVIAEAGISGVTVSRVVALAGVSRGLINLHFATKEAMLAEVIETLTAEWQAGWRAQLARPGLAPAERLAAMLLGNFQPPVFQADKLSTWHCFYADPWYRQVYHRRCHAADQDYLEAIAGLCEALDREGGYRLGPGILVARALRSMTGGLWLELLTEPRQVSLEEARRACRLVLWRIFPKHFEAPQAEALPQRRRPQLVDTESG